VTATLHVLATATYVVATLALLVILLPAARRETDLHAQRRLLATWLRRYNVTSVGALGVLVITGASMVTDWKAMLGADFGRLLWRLTGKLGLSFLLINLATYLSFGLAHRLVVAELGQLPIDPAKQDGMLRRMATAGWLGLALAAWTAWLGYRLRG
jgi:uncharacterized membrane protein